MASDSMDTMDEATTATHSPASASHVASTNLTHLQSSALREMDTCEQEILAAFVESFDDDSMEYLDMEDEMADITTCIDKVAIADAEVTASASTPEFTARGPSVMAFPYRLWIAAMKEASNQDPHHSKSKNGPPSTSIEQDSDPDIAPPDASKSILPQKFKMIAQQLLLSIIQDYRSSNSCRFFDVPHALTDTVLEILLDRDQRGPERLVDRLQMFANDVRQGRHTDWQAYIAPCIHQVSARDLWPIPSEHTYVPDKARENALHAIFGEINKASYDLATTQGRYVTHSDMRDEARRAEYAIHEMNVAAGVRMYGFKAERAVQRWGGGPGGEVLR